jgi:hypothetical protein
MIDDDVREDAVERVAHGVGLAVHRQEDLKTESQANNTTITCQNQVDRSIPTA